ncbi:hypothetical protein B0H66DRAFT_17870 [Apodospora peruviana]|uniref:Uncharacterized protein n=1 Tax=Apodospora peruviana TaxID=516989 RepID=A0AAE0IQF1_9PEZI|nr:hypothetical protein B0H66DRAFT_17870 [Apodospora peruviana]
MLKKLYSLGTLSSFLLASITHAAPSPPITARSPEVDKKYIFATFHAEKEQQPDEKTSLNIYWSDNAHDFEEYAMDVYHPEKGVVRDPSIIHYLGKYYVVHTTGWHGNEIAIISSDDLKSWSPVTTINVGDFGAAWAPEFFWDPNDQSLNIIVSLQKGGHCPSLNFNIPCRPAGQFKPFIMSANAGETAKSWSEPKEIELVTNRDSHIDMFVVHKGDDQERPYHAFIKNEKSKVIEHWWSGSVAGPYNWIGVANGKWGKMEGPAVTQVESDGKTKWILYADNYHGTYFWAESDNLYDWTEMKELGNQSKNVRHGTVLKKTEP